MFRLLLILAMVFSGYACSSDTGTQTPQNHSNNTVLNNAQDVGNDGQTSPDGDITTDMGAQDSSPDGADEDQSQAFRVVEAGRVMDPDVLYECNCANPEDACTIHADCVHIESGRCPEPGVEGFCPEGYVCLESHQCFSNTGRTALCERDEDCPFYKKCDHRGLCISEIHCKNHANCPYGETCSKTGPDSSKDVCDTPGPKLAGESCTTGYECESGRCQDGSCQMGCWKNQDCPVDYVCSSGTGLCTGSPTFRQQCPNGVWLGGYSTCLPDSTYCSHSEQCGNGNDCKLESTSHLGTCETTPAASPCKPNEVASRKQPEFCFLQQRCNAVSGCPANYECVEVDMHQVNFSWCARSR